MFQVFAGVLETFHFLKNDYWSGLDEGEVGLNQDLRDGVGQAGSFYNIILEISFLCWFLSREGSFFYSSRPEPFLKA